MSTTPEQIRRDGVAKASILSKQAMQAEIARVVRQAWQDRVGKIIGLSEQARKSTTIG